MPAPDSPFEAARTQRRHGRWLVALGLLGPVVLLSAISAPELAEVWRTGLCPPAPTDIPAYPCGPLEYLWTRVLFNPWAVLVTGPIYLVFGGVALLGAVGWWRGGGVCAESAQCAAKNANIAAR